MVAPFCAELRKLSDRPASARGLHTEHLQVDRHEVPDIAKLAHDDRIRPEDLTDFRAR